MIANEGSLKVGPDAAGCKGGACGGYCDPTLAPYPLPYGIMTPRSGEVGNLLVPVAVSASHVAFNSIRMEPQWMILGHAAGVAATMATPSAGAGVSVGDVDVAALRLRLKEQGQILIPPALPPPPPPPPLPPRPSTGVWFAWKQMFKLVNQTIAATEAKSLLKRVTTVPSGKLPPSEVCRVPMGTVLRLTRPAETTADGYFRVALVGGQRCPVAAAINLDDQVHMNPVKHKMDDGGGRLKTANTNVSASHQRARQSGLYPWPWLHGGAFTNPPRAASLDPLVQYVWPSAVDTSKLQLYTVTAKTIVADRPSSFGGLHGSAGGPITVQDEGCLRMDFGEENAGWLEFDAQGLPAAQDVSMSISEYNEPAVVNTGSKTAAATKLSGQGGAPSYRLVLNPLLYEGVRFGWICVQNFSVPWTLTGIRLVAQSKPQSYMGSFASSEALLDRIWYTGAFVVRANLGATSFGSILINRGDRTTWAGDAHPAQAAALVAFGDYGFVNKSLVETGTNNGCVACPDCGIETYSAYWILSVVDYVRYSNDTAAMLRFADNIDAKLDHAATILQKIANGTMRLGTRGTQTMNFAGWDERLGAGFENPDQIEVHRLYKALIIRCANEAGKMMRPFGHPFSDKWLQQARSLSKNLGDVTTWGLHSVSDLINADAHFETPFLSPADKATIAAMRFNASAQICSFSPFNGYFVLQALGNLGLAEAALFSVLQCWGGMVELGGSMFWEIFSPEWMSFMTANSTGHRSVPDPVPNGQNGYTSLAHAWYACSQTASLLTTHFSRVVALLLIRGAGVAMWLTEHAAGIQPTEPGFASYRVRSLLARSDLLPSVTGSVPTPFGGTISVRIETHDTLSRCTVIAPEGTIGDVHLPKPPSVIDTSLYALTVDGTSVDWYDEAAGHIVVAGLRGKGGAVPIVLELSAPSAQVVPASPRRQLDKWSLMPRPEYSGRFVGADRSTQGRWRGKYGADGFYLFGAGSNGTDVEKLPAYVSAVVYSAPDTMSRRPYASNMRPPRHGIFSQASQLNSTAALLELPERRGASGSYVATNNPIACFQTFPVDVVVRGTTKFQLAVYSADVDRQARQMTISLFDRETKELVAPVQRVRGFEGGVWMRWEYDKSVRVRFSHVRGGDAVVAGLFFDRHNEPPAQRVAATNPPLLHPSPATGAAAR